MEMIIQLTISSFGCPSETFLLRPRGRLGMNINPIIPNYIQVGHSTNYRETGDRKEFSSSEGGRRKEGGSCHSAFVKATWIFHQKLSIENRRGDRRRREDSWWSKREPLWSVGNKRVVVISFSTTCFHSSPSLFIVTDWRVEEMENWTGGAPLSIASDCYYLGTRQTM